MLGTIVTETISDRVAREDLALFINAAFVCTGQREFYGSASGQAVSITFLHEYILGNYRLLYTRSLAAKINHFNSALVIANLLATGRDTRDGDRQEENAIIDAALRTLPTQRVLRLFDTLRSKRVNNRRTRAVMANYLDGKKDQAFVALKYRRRLRSVARHAHLRLPDEIGTLLFDRDWLTKKYTTPLFESFRKAHFSQRAVYQLPYTIAEGLAAKHGISRKTFLSGISPNMTSGEKLRMTNATSALDVRIDFDLRGAHLTKLALYICSLTIEQRKLREVEFTSALEVAAARAFRHSPIRLGRVAAILDRSYSSSGSTEKARRPLAIAIGTSALLRQASASYCPFWTPTLPNSAPELFVESRGQTNLADPFLSALEWGATMIIIVSDGHENDPPSAMARLAERHQQYRVALGQSPLPILHLNPAFDSQDYSPRSLGPNIPTIGLRNAEDALTQLAFAKFVDGTSPLSELERFLSQRIPEFLRSTDVPKTAQ